MACSMSFCAMIIIEGRLNEGSQFVRAEEKMLRRIHAPAALTWPMKVIPGGTTPLNWLQHLWRSSTNIPAPWIDPGYYIRHYLFNKALVIESISFLLHKYPNLGG